jgi:hypothetical protein
MTVPIAVPTLEVALACWRRLPAGRQNAVIEEVTIARDKMEDAGADVTDMDDAIAVLRATAWVAPPEPCMTDDCGKPRIEGWRWCRDCMDQGPDPEPIV